MVYFQSPFSNMLQDQMHILLRATFPVKNVAVGGILLVFYNENCSESQHKEQVCAPGFVLQSRDKINRPDLR